jgi:hypothetical protein
LSNNDPKVETTKSSLLSGQLIGLVWIVLGTLGCYLINPLYGWLFLAFASFSVYIIVRRMLCNSCYYCKSCTKGMAKMSILFRGANRIPGLSKGSVIGMSVYLYIVLFAIPGALLASSLLQEFSVFKVGLLAGLLAVSVFGLVMRLKNGNK